MHYRTLLKDFHPRLISSGIVFFALILSAIASISLAPKHAVTKKVLSLAEATPIITASPSVTPTGTVLGTNTKNTLVIAPTKTLPTPTPQIVKQTLLTTQTSSTQSQTSAPTPTTQIAGSPTSTPMPSPITTVSHVSLQIVTPSKTALDSIILKDGADVCSILEEAKSEGRISSLTLDDTYMSSLHSKYVREMNGFQDNWTFSVNGTSPLGCSLAHPKPNDTIVWKFN